MKRCPVLTKCAALGPSIKQLLASSTVLVVLLGIFEQLLLVVMKTSVLAPLSLSISVYLPDSSRDQADCLWVMLSNCCLWELGSLGERDFRVNVFAEQR